MPHSGITGRTERQKRYRARNHAKGLCVYCSNPSAKNKNYCNKHVKMIRQKNKEWRITHVR
jgi:hypothetical protein